MKDCNILLDLFKTRHDHSELAYDFRDTLSLSEFFDKVPFVHYQSCTSTKTFLAVMSSIVVLQTCWTNGDSITSENLIVKI